MSVVAALSYLKHSFVSVVLLLFLTDGAVTDFK